MKPYRGLLWCCALATLVMANGSTEAAWSNVFQVCCHNCRSSNYVAAPAPAPAACGSCQQPQCTTRYVQRCYYKPVTTYRQSCYMEPVTTYRTSYYYEPCTSYRYSCYYDPCTCGYQQVAQPVTSYRLRSRCCPVTSYLQRCCLQPVTSYQQAFYYEPQTTCCQTTIGAPVAAPGGVAVPYSPPPVVSSQPSVAPPAVSSQPSVAPPAVNSQPYGPPPAVNSTEAPPSGQNMKYNSQFSNPVPRMPFAPDSSSSRQPQLQAPISTQPVAPARTPQPRFDRITSAPHPNMAGQVIRADRLPQSRAQVLFVSADRKGGRQAITADDRGRFQTTLTSGTWLIYIQNDSGQLMYQQKVQVGEDQSPLLTLVSR
jgi:hypothetical protein